MGFDDIGEQLRRPDRCKETEQDILTKGPQEYAMPGPSYRDIMKQSSLDNYTAELIDDEFRLAYGVLEDFRRRVLLVNSKIKNPKVPTVERISQIPEALLKYYRTRPEYASLAEFIEWELLDRFRVPEVPMIFLDFHWVKGSFDSMVMLDSALLAVPVFYKTLMLPAARDTYIAAIAKDNIEEVEDLYVQADVVIKRKLRQQRKIHDWFDTWTYSK